MKKCTGCGDRLTGNSYPWIVVAATNMLSLTLNSLQVAQPLNKAQSTSILHIHACYQEVPIIPATIHSMKQKIDACAEEIIVVYSKQALLSFLAV